MGADRALHGQPHDRAGHDDRERGAALDPHRPRVHRVLAGLGRERLPADVRRLPAAGRPAGRHLRAPQAVPDRPGAVHGIVGGLRPLDRAGRADRGAGRAGRGRGDRGGGGAVAGDDAVRGAGRAGQGDGRDRVRRRRRRQHRRAAGRRADRCARLALDLPGQPAGRHRRVRRLPQPGAGRPVASADGAAGCRRGGDRDLGADGRGVRDRERQPGGMGDRPDARPAGRGRGGCWSCSW